MGAREEARRAVDPHGVMENAEELAFDMGFDAGVAEGIRQAREAVVAAAERDATWAGDVYSSDMLAAIDAL